jgi:hypothetical protein
MNRQAAFGATVMSSKLKVRLGVGKIQSFSLQD